MSHYGNQNANFVGVPIGGWSVPQQHANTANEIPARVSAAMEFLNRLTAKTAQQDLLPVEEEARAAALKMLMAYFAGQLYPSQWEVMLMHGDMPSVSICPKCMADLEKRKECEICSRQGVIVVSRGR